MATNPQDLLKLAQQQTKPKENKMEFSGLVETLKRSFKHRSMGGENNWGVTVSPNGLRITVHFVNQTNVKAEFTKSKATIYEGNFRKVLYESNPSLANYFKGESAFPQ
jgi:hypothetical protein